MPMMLTASLLLLASPTVLRLLFDYWWISRGGHQRSGKSITATGYKYRTMATSIVAAGASILSHNLTPTPPLILHMTLALGVFVGFFDYCLSLLRGLDWKYISPDPKHNSVVERLYQKTNPYVILAVKAVILGLSAYLFLTYTN